ncbi:MAG: Crp/Fnr family transcriptional regulator [Phaeovulum sp.]|uniref:Crp/Fnr family transcriptional regulator n=1 Tax=Phaeovulum sp. TaxID=2934796 RepID=UPI00272F0613|nr:Crp/Fnr family transcriptional regulator [Phaeovulum sp.]MDP2062317.1 Crp/Fnr family transcriptional regulator [Phaeovulum sp.]MDP3860212.1 Crp/Fnr family transcriptional regulator [Phaeovulum sp.]
MQTGFQRIFGGAPERVVAPGEALFRTADAVRQMHLVRAGSVLLERVTHAGTRILLQQAHAGVVVSEASAYSPAYHCDAAAGAQGARCAILPVTEFHARLAADPGAATAWAAGLAQAVQAARLRAELRSLRTVAERLDAWLGEHRKLPERGCWQDIAAELGVSREALYRELARRR